MHHLLRTPTSLLARLRTPQPIRRFARDPFPNKVTHYLRRAELIDSIRLTLRTEPPSSLASVLNTRLLDPFVVTHAIRSAPNADYAVSLVETLDKVPHFKHEQCTVHALAKVFARCGRVGELKELVDGVEAGRFGDVRISYMDLLRWYSAAGDHESVVSVWEKYRLSLSDRDRGCAESYNIVMQVYAQKGMDLEAVRVFHRMIDEGAVPNSRTYTIMIEHLVMSGKLDSAMEVFKVLPLMRVKRTLKQYLVLVEGLTIAKQFGDVRVLLDEMKVGGVLPGRAMRLSLQRMREAGFVEETEMFLKEMLPDERIKSIGYCLDSTDDDEEVDEDVDDSAGNVDFEGVQLKPWLDPRALANALKSWDPEEVSALQDADFVWTTRLVCKILRNFRSPKTAWDFFCWVACQPGFNHDAFTVQRMIVLLARHGHVELVDKLIDKIRREGIRLPFNSIRLIIDFYGISKNADAALKVFREFKTLCGPISKFNLMLLYSSLLRTLTKCQRDSDALEMLDDMILGGTYPDIQTYCGLMHHFAVQGDIKTVQKLLTMVRQSGMEPDAYMFKVLIQDYCKCGRAALAWRLFEDMRNSRFMPDFATKELLVRTLWKEGKRREAAAVEESCEEARDILPLSVQGHIWTVSSTDLSKVYGIYSDCFA